MKLLFALLTAFILLACAQPKVKKAGDTTLYLRADFTYWEANPAFAFATSEQAEIQFLTADIVYDGNPYRLVVADKAWSANKNCGYANSANRVLSYGQWFELGCYYNAEKNSITPIQKPLEFTPLGSGKYLFELKLDAQGAPTHIRVSAIKSKKKVTSNHTF